MKRRDRGARAARRQGRRPDHHRTARRPADTDRAPRRCSDLQFSWTSTGISLSFMGLTVEAEHATNNHYGQRALVSVRSGNWLCYRQRINLEDPHQRQAFIAKLVLSCKQAEMK